MRRPVLAFVLVMLAAAPLRAAFHVAVIDEIMSGVGGDPTQQYVEIRQLFQFQNQIMNTRLTAFDCSGHVAELLLVPLNLLNTNAGRWIMASTDPIGGITPDFTFSPGIPQDCGMVCWGAPGLVLPPDPSTWLASDPSKYVDCVAYGPFPGTLGKGVGTPTPLTAGDGTQSLTRNTNTTDNSADFALACPSPTNAAGDVGAFGGAGCTTTTTTTLPDTRERLSGKKLLLTTKKITVLSKDKSIGLGDGNGSADDPVANGGSLRIVTSAGDAFDSTLALTGGWRYLGKQGQNKGYKYKSKGAVKSIVLKAGKMLKVVGKGALAISLGTNPDPVAVVLQLGTGGFGHCLAFGGAPNFKAGKRYTAKGAGAPAACPP